MVPRAHDAAGRTGGAPTTYTYDAAGRLTQRSDPGIVWKRTYDPNSGVLQAQSISSDPGHVLLASDAYTGFDPEGNVTAEEQKIAAPVSGAISTRTWSFAYDDANRLWCMRPSDGSATRYSYDGQGDRLTSKTAATCAGTATATVTTSYDARGLPEAMTAGTVTTHYCSDPAGDLTAALQSSGWSCAHGYPSSTITPGDEAYRYDAFSDMVSEQVKTSAATTLTYDGLGRASTAVRSTAPPQSTYYGYSGASHDLAKLEKAGVTTQLAYGPYGPFAQKVTGAAVQYEMKDLHGDVVGLAAGGAATTPAATRSFDPWGVPLGPTTAAVLGYQGDPSVGDSRLIQTDTRAIDPSAGRFMSQDVLFGGTSDPMSLNQFVYGEDNPVTNADPTGTRVESGSGAADEYCDSSCDSAARSFHAYQYAQAVAGAVRSVDLSSCGLSCSLRDVHTIRTVLGAAVHVVDVQAGRIYNPPIGAAIGKVSVLWGARSFNCGNGATCYKNARFPALLGADGWTYGDSIFCRTDCSQPAQRTLIDHEMVHVEQFRDVGLSFPVRYGYQLAVNGSGCSNSYEAPAYEKNPPCP